MHRHLFGHVDLPPNRAHVLDGTVPEAFAAEHAAQFDRWIAADGGLDLQLLGIGRNGHIGFNEPTTCTSTRPWRCRPGSSIFTRSPSPTPPGISAAPDHVIDRALTLGVAPILAARSIVVLALGGARPRPSPARSPGL